MMNEMVRLDIGSNTDGENITITSIELVELINEFRKIESDITNRQKANLRHNDFMGKIRKELEVLQSLGLSNERNINESDYKDKKGEIRPCYELNRDGIKHIIDITKNTDRFPLQRAYESLGGDYSSVVCIDRFEDSFMSKLTNTLSVVGINIVRNYPVMSYHLDGYIEELNVAIEYDEAHHRVEPQRSMDIIRQEEVERELGCTFIRLDYENKDATNIGIVINNIMEVK